MRKKICYSYGYQITEMNCRLFSLKIIGYKHIPLIFNALLKLFVFFSYFNFKYNCNLKDFCHKHFIFISSPFYGKYNPRRNVSSSTLGRPELSFEIVFKKWIILIFLRWAAETIQCIQYKHDIFARLYFPCLLLLALFFPFMEIVKILSQILTFLKSFSKKGKQILYLKLSSSTLTNI